MKNRVMITLLACVVSAILGSAVTFQSLSAGPLDIREPLNTGTEPIFRSATYVPQSVAAYIIEPDSDDPNASTRLLLIGQVLTEVIMPGGNVPRKSRALGYMYIEKEDLKRFPTALQLVRSEDLVCHPIDTKNFKKGLFQLKKAYSEAFNLSVDQQVQFR